MTVWDSGAAGNDDMTLSFAPDWNLGGRVALPVGEPGEPAEVHETNGCARVHRR